jgi:hypothetical protein
VPKFIDPVFAKRSPNCSFSVIENERFQLVFAKTGSNINSGTVDAGCSLGEQLSDVEFHILDESDNISGVHSIWFFFIRLILKVKNGIFQTRNYFLQIRSPDLYGIENPNYAKRINIHRE